MQQRRLVSQTNFDVKCSFGSDNSAIILSLKQSILFEPVNKKSHCHGAGFFDTPSKGKLDVRI